MARTDRKGRRRVRRFVSVIDGLNVVLTVIVGLLLAVVACSVMYQVLVRFVLTAAGFNISAPWTEELARYTLIWMVFLGAAVGVRHARMIALEFGIRKLPPRAGIPLRYAAMLLAMGFFGLLVWVGLDFVDLGRSETSPVLGITKDRVYWAMPVGMALMIVNSLALMAETWLEGRDIRFAADFAPGE
jgi:TRAP-type C4-dicarboxylate transport system permease small subunit